MVTMEFDRKIKKTQIYVPAQIQLDSIRKILITHLKHQLDDDILKNSKSTQDMRQAEIKRKIKSIYLNNMSAF